MDDTDKQVTGWTGWIMFAAIMMIIAGIAHTVYGLASLFNQGWYLYVNEQLYIVDSTTGGWLLMLIGILLLISGALLFSGNIIGRIMGVVLATLGILANLAYIGIAPIWSIVGIVVNAIVLYAIGAHGSEMKRVE